MTNGKDAVVKLRSAHCCESCLEQQDRRLSFEHRLLTQSRHQNLRAVSRHILETDKASMRETHGMSTFYKCGVRNQRQGYHGRDAIRT